MTWPATPARARALGQRYVVRDPLDFEHGKRSKKTGQIIKGDVVNQIALLFLSLFFFGCASQMPAEQAAASFEKIVDVPGLSKDSLYDGIKLWVAESFKSAKAVIQLDNKEQGILIGNGSIDGICVDHPVCAKRTMISFKMKIEVKDQKFRISFSELDPVGGYGLLQGELDEVKPQLLMLGDEISTSLLKRKSEKAW